MMIFRDPVTPLQAVGYSIALGGLVYYKLGGDKIKEYTRQGSVTWQEYGVRHPIVRRLIVFGSVLLGAFVLLNSILPDYRPLQSAALGSSDASAAASTEE